MLSRNAGFAAYSPVHWLINLINSSPHSLASNLQQFQSLSYWIMSVSIYDDALKLVSPRLKCSAVKYLPSFFRTAIWNQSAWQRVWFRIRLSCLNDRSRHFDIFLARNPVNNSQLSTYFSAAAFACQLCARGKARRSPTSLGRASASILGFFGPSDPSLASRWYAPPSIGARRKSSRCLSFLLFFSFSFTQLKLNFCLRTKKLAALSKDSRKLRKSFCLFSFEVEKNVCFENRQPRGKIEYWVFFGG